MTLFRIISLSARLQPWCLAAFVAGPWGGGASRGAEAEAEEEPVDREELETPFDDAEVENALADPDACVALAVRLLARAENGVLRPDHQRLLLEKAFDVAASHAAGADTALLAFEAWVVRLAPEEVEACWLRRLEMRRRHYEDADKEERNVRGQAYLDDLLAAAEPRLLDEGGRASEWCAAAARVAARIKSPDAARIKDLADRAKAATEAYAQWDRYLARLQDRPDDASLRAQAMLHAVTALDRPAWAEGLSIPEMNDAALRARVALLAREQRGATEEEALDLADWLDSLLPKAPPHTRERLIGHALAGYRRFRTLHTDDGPLAAQADAAIARLEARIAAANDGRKANAAKGRSPAAGTATDLLALFKSDRHQVKGRWSRDKEGLKSDSEVGSRIMLPATVQGAYVFEVEFVVSPAKNNTAFLLFPVGDHQASITFDSFDATWSGLEMHQGRRVNEPGHPAASRGRKFSSGQAYRCVVTVQPDAKKGTVSVACVLDKNTLFSWEGPMRDITLPDRLKLPDPGCFGLATFQSPLTWKSATVRPLRGGKVVLLK